jgi:hypothetical protein
MISILRLKESHWEKILEDADNALNRLSHLASGAVREFLEEAIFDYRARIAISDSGGEDNNEEEAADGGSDADARSGFQYDPQSDCETPYGMECEDDVETKVEPDDDHGDDDGDDGDDDDNRNSNGNGDDGDGNGDGDDGDDDDDDDDTTAF